MLQLFLTQYTCTSGLKSNSRSNTRRYRLTRHLAHVEAVFYVDQTMQLCYYNQRQIHRNYEAFKHKVFRIKPHCKTKQFQSCSCFSNNPALYFFLKEWYKIIPARLQDQLFIVPILLSETQLDTYFEHEITVLPVSFRPILVDLPQLTSFSSLSQTMNEASLGNGLAQNQFRQLNTLITCWSKISQTPDNSPYQFWRRCPSLCQLQFFFLFRTNSDKKKNMLNNNVRPITPCEILQ